jgi:hypothetical protein
MKGLRPRPVSPITDIVPVVTASAEPVEIVTQLIILDGAAERALLSRAGGAPSLPVVRTRNHWHLEVPPIIDAVRDELGMTVTAVRCIGAKKAEGVTDVLWVMQAEGDMPAQERVEWLPLADLRAVDGNDAAKEAISAWLDAPPGRTPWLRPRWRDDALGWAQDRLAEHGRAVTGAPQQFRHWSITSLWRIPTDRGDAWFKAVLPMFAHEGTLIRLISPSMPEHLPRVIATERDRGWMLTEALPVPWMRDHAEWQRETAGAQYEESLRVLARLQQAWIGREAELFAAGCTDRRLATLPQALDELLASDMLRAGLTDVERARLADFGSEIPARVEELRSCGIPETLLHGDFHSGNIARDGGRTIIFDWTDGCVGHPFFDMPTFLPDDPVERAALLDVYLDEWRAYLAGQGVPVGRGAVDVVERAWELAEPLACIHHALSYMRILAAVEPPLQTEFDSDVTFWLRWLRAIISPAV